jgi:hypothetical protein
MTTDGSTTDHDVDAGLLQKVRALLSQAESTTFPQEAEAFTAKAQQLIARHRIDHALLDDGGGAGAGSPSCRDLPVFDPYATAKFHLFHVVADANGCEAVYATWRKTASIFGAPADLDLVETLVTSLLVQASVAVQAAGPQRDRYGRSTTRSFRRSFYLAYAQRVGERLQAAIDEVYDDLDERDLARALPVLADRAADVRAAAVAAYPNAVQRGAVVSNGAGYAAGRDAADRADLSTSPPSGQARLAH